MIETIFSPVPTLSDVMLVIKINVSNFRSYNWVNKSRKVSEQSVRYLTNTSNKIDMARHPMRDVILTSDNQDNKVSLCWIGLFRISGRIIESPFSMHYQKFRPYRPSTTRGLNKDLQKHDTRITDFYRVRHKNSYISI